MTHNLNIRQYIKYFSKPAIVRVGILLIGFVFILASINKSLYPLDAVDALAPLGLKGTPARSVICLVAIGEMFLGIRLFCIVDRLTYVKIVWTVLLCFTIYLLWISGKGVKTCGCTGLETLFGETSAMKVSLLRNVALMILSSVYIQRNNEVPNPNRVNDKPNYIIKDSKVGKARSI